MTLLLRRMRAQARIDGTDPSPWENPEDDYAVVDDTTIVRRIYREMILGKLKWRWFFAVHPRSRSGEADPASETRNGRYAPGGKGGLQGAVRAGQEREMTAPLRIIKRCHTPGKHLTPYQ
jgi:hypothetical protein